jgi:hypothetical protein
MMPKSDLHKSKKKKNLTILAVIAAWVAIIWIITMIKVNHGG